MIALRAELPRWLEAGAETAVGLVIVALAVRVSWKWLHGDYRAGPHRHGAGDVLEPEPRHRHLHRHGHDHDHVRARTPGQAFAIGLLHGLAGTGAVVVLMIAALPTQLEAAAALAVFAPMSVVSMAGLSGVFAWVLARPAVEPAFRAFLIPALGLFGLGFGLSYTGIV